MHVGKPLPAVWATDLKEDQQPYEATVYFPRRMLAYLSMYLFTYGLFNSAISNLDQIAWSDGVVIKNKLETKCWKLVVALKYICIHCREREKLDKHLFRGISGSQFEPGTNRKKKVVLLSMLQGCKL
jgi:hypothetical protein